MAKAKVLLLDVETAPIIAYVWGLWDQNVGLNQIKSDWHLLSFSAKWLGDPPSKVIYHDQRKAKNIENDKPLLLKLWKLLDEADVIITQNGISFDAKKINARFILNGMKPPSPYKHIDTVRIARKRFGFTSNKLEYLSNNLCTKYKKLKHAKFSGFELWKECLAGNLDAWDEMKKYNQYDVLALEELFTKLQPWDNTVNFSLIAGDDPHCNCGSDHLVKRGFSFTASGKYQRYVCQDCGAWHQDKANLLDKDYRKNVLKGI